MTAGVRYVTRLRCMLHFTAQQTQDIEPIFRRCWLGCCVWETVDISVHQSLWNESGFRPPLCTYRLNWARRTSWGWWDDSDDTVLQTQESKFEPWRSEAEHATSRSRREETFFVSFKPPRPGTEPRTLAWKAAVLTTTLGPPPTSPYEHVHKASPVWQQTGDNNPILFQCWASVEYDWPALNQQWAATLAQHWTGTWGGGVRIGLHCVYQVHRTFRILAHDENQYSYVYKILGNFFV